MSVRGTMRTPRISDVQYRLFCDLVQRSSGLHFGDGSRSFVEKRLARRVEEIGIDSFASYLYRLRSAPPGDDELPQLIDHLTTNETYFFRERRQLQALMQEILPEMLLRRRSSKNVEPVRIWSAGCSSGEEPCSIVMLALEAGLEPERDLRVYGSDISRSVLARARRGEYREASFRETPDTMRELYFQKKQGGFRLSDDVKRHVNYIHLNLNDPKRLAILGRMDVILCRNVIIYFDAATRKRVIDSFHEKLRPGGYLLLGHSESLVNISSAFELCHLENDLVYRRPQVGEARTDSWHRLAEEALAVDPKEGSA